MLSPSIEALVNGNARIASTVALAMSAVNDSLAPLRSYSAFFLSRSCESRWKSTSYTEYTCGEVCALITMCSAIFLRMIVIGTISTRSPSLNAGTWPEDGDGRCALPSEAAAAAEEGDELMNPRMSFLVTRPLMPVPLIRLMSTLCSFAMRRTSGGVRCLPSSFASGCPAAASGSAVTPVAGEAGDCPAEAAPAAKADAAPEAVSAGGTFSPADPITATTEFTGTVSPSLTLISVSTPAPGDGISASTLSVEISKRGSSRSTLSPIFLIHRTMVPSAIDSPICGITTLVGICLFSQAETGHGRDTKLAKFTKTTKNFVIFVTFVPLPSAVSVLYQSLRSGDHFLDARQKRLLERRCVGDRGVHRRDAHDRRVEVLEGLFGNDRRQLAADAAGAPRLVEQQRAARLGHRREDRLAIQRRQAPEIDDLRLHAVGLQLLRGVERRVHHRAERQDRQVAAFALHFGLPDRDDVVLLRHVVLDAAVQELVLEVQDRVVVPNRGLEESLRVVGGRGLDHLEAGRVPEVGFGIQRVERAAADTAAGRPAAEARAARAVPVPARRGEVRQHVEAAGDEVDELDLAHWPDAHVGRADRLADDRLLGNRRIDDALLAELLDQPFGDLECAAVRADVFAHDEDAVVGRHLVEERLADGFEIGDDWHVCARPT